MHRAAEGVRVQLKDGSYTMRVTKVEPNFSGGGVTVFCDWLDAGGCLKTGIFCASDLKYVAPPPDDPA